MFKSLALISLIGVATASVNNHFAVIVAGSNGWWNYRHQADACHAYQIVKRNGIPEENIIHMAYDDIANNPENPFPGKLFNKPNGEDVYAGCKIDYTGSSVTPSNFLNILKGNKAAIKGGNGKVLNTNEESKVFIFFSDHGAPGLIAFPSEYLYANDLNSAIEYMHENKRYKELVFYLEACESGSMFDGILRSDINAYAITAANPYESSWGTYCYPDDAIGNVHMGTCLGDLFSVVWMEDSDKKDLRTVSLETQFQYILQATSLSHVMRYGGLEFKAEPIGNFQGSWDDEFLQEKEPKKVMEFFRRKLQSPAPVDPETFRKSISTVSSRDAKLHHLYAHLQEKGGHRVHLDMQQELTSRMMIDHVFEELVPSHLRSDEPVLPRNFACLKGLMDTYTAECGALGDYGLKYVKYFVQTCESLPEAYDFSHLARKIAVACEH
jgi:legumain